MVIWGAKLYLTPKKTKLPLDDTMISYMKDYYSFLDLSF
jgi:hypothetical protein